MEKAGKGGGKGNKPYLFFTGAMLLCCIGLYVAQSVSAARKAAPEATPAPTPLAHSYPAEDAFLENAAAFGLEADLAPQTASLPATKEYLLTRPGLADACLTLSFQGGGVCAFLLQTPLLEAPKALAKGATPIEADLHEKAQAAYDEERAWRQEALQGLCAALDVTGTCTAVELSRFYALLEETAGKGASREDKGGHVAFSSYVLGEGEGRLLCAAASRLD